MANFTPRNWTNGYVVQATDLVDLEQRITAYAAKAGVDVFEPANQTAMLALNTAEKGDIAFRLDTNDTYILVTEPASMLGNWKKFPVPNASTTTTFSVSSQAAMLASGAIKGDLAVRSDVAKTYVLSQSPATTLANWIELPATGGDPVGSAAAAQAYSIQRANHTGTQTSSTISDFSSAVVAAASTAIDAKGDLLVGSADNTRVRLPVGANGQVLTADSTQTSGTRWATPTGGGGGGADRPDDMRMISPGAIVPTPEGTAFPQYSQIPYVVTRPGTMVSVIPRVNEGHPPSGRDAIAGIRRRRSGTTVDLFSSDSVRPKILAGATTGATVTPDQNADVQAGDELFFGKHQGGYALEAAGFLGSAAQNGIAATTGTTFTVPRPTSQNEVQTITLANATGGTFTLAKQAGGTASASIAYNASAATVQTALQGLYGSGNVTVTGSNGGPWTATWVSAEAAKAQRLMTYVSSLTGSTTPTITIARTTTGQVAPETYNPDSPQRFLLAVLRNNTTTTVSAVDGVAPPSTQLVDTDDAAGGRYYVFSFPDDGATTWTFTQSGVASSQGYLLAWTQAPASTTPIESVGKWKSTSASADFTIPAVTTPDNSTDRIVLAFVFSSLASTSPDHRNPPSSGSWLTSNPPPRTIQPSGGSNVVGSRIGVLRRFPGSQFGTMGPYTGGKFKDVNDTDISRDSGVLAVALTPRESDPGEDLSLTCVFTA